MINVNFGRSLNRNLRQVFLLLVDSGRVFNNLSGLMPLWLSVSFNKLSLIMSKFVLPCSKHLCGVGNNREKFVGDDSVVKMSNF